MDAAARRWVSRAVELLREEERGCAETPLKQLALPHLAGISLFFKDESTQPSGSLKHRLARSLILSAICDGRVVSGVPLIDASSGSTAVSEAYYAKLLGLDFYAVLPSTTSRSKLEHIERYGGRFRFVDDASQLHSVAVELARELGGHYLDQFTYAERATDWRRNNVAEAILRQLHGRPPLAWLVMSAGTGGTSSTMGRYLRYSGAQSRLCVPDVEHSVFYDGWVKSDRSMTCDRGSRIEGIGRPRVEPSFLFDVVDAMVRFSDAASIAASRILSDRLGCRVGGSTGTNFIGALWAADQMRQAGQSGSIASLICDNGERYRDTYFSDVWLQDQGIDIAPYTAMISDVLEGAPFNPKLLMEQSIRF